MHILYASNENYLCHAAASMVSVMENNQQVEELDFYLISMGTAPQSIEKMKKLAAGYNRSVNVVELADLTKRLDFSFNTRGFDVSALARLFVGTLLPADVSKVIYLDCDTIVLDSLQELWETPLENELLGMVAEPTAPMSRRLSLGMDPWQAYHNSGVLLIDLEAWRDTNAEKTVFDYYQKMGGALIAPDQDALNGAFAGRIKALSPRYNYGTINIYYPWKMLKKLSGQAAYISKEEYDLAAAKPAIIHYLGEERPWREGTTHPFTWAYEKYLAMTPWKDTPKEQGWKTYFACFRLFNAVTRPVPMVRYKVINALIPAFMKWRENQRKRQKK
ncbi:MAG: glycosyltransferase family 8 protein [Clostridia bacterium]|nr:glycosyltransferase family 8 protein [Clostridia bacterium]